MSNYREKQTTNQPVSECTLPYEQLAWFRDKKPSLMPFGGWDRLNKMEAK